MYIQYIKIPRPQLMTDIFILMERGNVFSISKIANEKLKKMTSQSTMTWQYFSGIKGENDRDDMANDSSEWNRRKKWYQRLNIVSWTLGQAWDWGCTRGEGEKQYLF